MRHPRITVGDVDLVCSFFTGRAITAGSTPSRSL
jgi:hypothetical protein